MSKHRLLLIVPTIITLALATSGCATRRYVRNQIKPVDQRITDTQAQTNEQFAKQGTEISRVDERLTSVDNRVTAVDNRITAVDNRVTAVSNMVTANTAKLKGATQALSSEISTQSSEISKLAAGQNYSLVETGNVTFRINRSDLTKDAKVALDLMIQKASAQPRTVLEIEGFTDPTGPTAYNLTLSRKRAETVARYLVKNNIPLKNIQLLGLGEDHTKEHALARHVRVRMFQPGATAASAAPAASGSQATAQLK